MRQVMILASALGTVLAGGCSTPTEPQSSYSIDVPNLRWFLELGDQFRFQAVRIDSSGRSLGPVMPAWSSSNPAVVTIDGTGLATAHSLGSSYITASLPTTSNSWELHVVPRIARLLLSPDSLTLPPGDRALFAAIPLDGAGAEVEVPFPESAIRWSTSAPLVARFEQSGGQAFLSALGEGRATIEADLFGRTGHATVTVQPVVMVELSLGGLFSCALGTDSLPYCWGAGREFLDFGPGTGPWSQAHIPRRPAAVKSLASLTAGGRHACGLTPDREALCWGSNEWGALGLGSAEQPNGPVPVSAGLRFTALSAGGFHTCGIATDLQTYCWGIRHQSMGDASGVRCGTEGKGAMTLPCNRAPVPVEGLPSPLTSLSAGNRHTCGLDLAGRAWCWGLFPSRGPSAPELVGSSLVFTQLASGSGYTCGLTPPGEALCWGGNGEGQLGDGTMTSRDQPRQVAGSIRFVALSAGQSSHIANDEGHVCGLTAEGAAYCWGRNFSGELGTPTGPPQSSPALVPTSIRFSHVRAGEGHTCGRSRDDGLVYCWGNNHELQLGVPGGDSYLPVPVSGQPGGGR